MVKCQNTIITPSYECLTQRGQFDAKRWGQFTTKYKGSICREMRGSDCAEYPAGLYRIGFTTYKVGEVNGGFLAQIGAPVKLPGVIVAESLDKMIELLGK